MIPAINEAVTGFSGNGENGKWTRRLNNPRLTKYAIAPTLPNFISSTRAAMIRRNM
jgi:hypothetical protein